MHLVTLKKHLPTDHVLLLVTITKRNYAYSSYYFLALMFLTNRVITIVLNDTVEAEIVVIKVCKNNSRNM